MSGAVGLVPLRYRYVLGASVVSRRFRRSFSRSLAMLSLIGLITFAPETQRTGSCRDDA
jgi:hypothetical protein